MNKTVEILQTYLEYAGPAEEMGATKAGAVALAQIAVDLHRIAEMMEQLRDREDLA